MFFKNDINLNNLIFQKIFEYSINAIEIYDGTGKLLDINQASLNIFGISRKEEIENFNFFDDPNITPERKSMLYNGDEVCYDTIINFDEVQKNNLFKTTKTGTMKLAVRIIPFLENDILRAILFIGEEKE